MAADTLPDRARALLSALIVCDDQPECDACAKDLASIEQALSRERAAALEEAAKLMLQRASTLSSGDQDMTAFVMWVGMVARAIRELAKKEGE